MSGQPKRPTLRLRKPEDRPAAAPNGTPAGSAGKGERAPGSRKPGDRKPRTRKPASPRPGPRTPGTQRTRDSRRPDDTGRGPNPAARAAGQPDETAQTLPPQSRLFLFSPCPRGLEEALAAELAGLGAAECVRVPGGVTWSGDTAAMYRANLGSRLASRVLMRVAQGPYTTEEDLYRLARSVDWKRRFPVSHTLRVDITAIRSPLKSLEFATLRVKDAVCDRFRDDLGRRPSVDTRNPDVRIAVFVDASEATVYLDTSGEPLWKRGWRRGGAEIGGEPDADRGEAPLRENLAAGLIALSGWDGRSPFADPMCGSGTIAIEAAQIALAIPPGHARRFGFERLHGFDAALWSQVRETLLARRRPVQRLDIWATDREMRAVERTRAALRAAGLEGAVHTRAVDILKFVPPPLEGEAGGSAEGVMISNPPYGVRLEQKSSLATFYPKLGDALKANFPGWRCHLFSGDPELARGIRLQPGRKVPLFNGALECRLYEYRIVAGSNRKP